AISPPILHSWLATFAKNVGRETRHDAQLGMGLGRRHVLRTAHDHRAGTPHRSPCARHHRAYRPPQGQRSMSASPRGKYSIKNMRSAARGLVPTLTAMKAFFIINDPPYGTERVYNALRLAHSLAKQDAANQLTVFLMADAVLAAKARQKTPDGFYYI